MTYFESLIVVIILIEKKKVYLFNTHRASYAHDGWL